MSRKNILELLQRDYDIAEEAKRIEDLFTNYILKFDIGYSIERTLEGYFNDYLFMQWEHSDTFFNIDEYRSHLDILPELVEACALDFDACLRYFEYVINVITQILINARLENKTIPDKIKRNIKALVNHFNYRIHNDDKQRFLMIVENNPAATAVAEMVEDDDVSRDIIRYNHFMLKGNLTEKRKILSQLYKEFERVRDNIEDVVKINKSHSLDSDVGLLFNNTDIRHYKGSNKVVQENFKALPPNEQEKWYDRIYDMFLNAILTNNYVEIKNDIKKLKQESKDE